MLSGGSFDVGVLGGENGGCGEDGSENEGTTRLKNIASWSLVNFMQGGEHY